LSISSLTIKQLADTDAEQNLQVTTSMLSWGAGSYQQRAGFACFQVESHHGSLAVHCTALGPFMATHYIVAVQHWVQASLSTASQQQHLAAEVSALAAYASSTVWATLTYQGFEVRKGMGANHAARFLSYSGPQPVDDDDETALWCSWTSAGSS
jgi:hypothetical protein